MKVLYFGSKLFSIRANNYRIITPSTVTIKFCVMAAVTVLSTLAFRAFLFIILQEPGVI